jgi:hypothetical protein
MCRLRRFISAFLIIVLMPATVMAGPLRLCLGQDGHRQIEFVHGGHHDHDQVAPDSKWPSTVSQLPSGRTCLDLALLTESTSPNTLQKSTVGDQDSQPIAALLPVFEVLSAPWSAALAVKIPEPGEIPDPRLQALRTVILLI